MRYKKGGRKWVCGVTISVVAALLAGCGNGGSAGGTDSPGKLIVPEKPPEPVTLSFYDLPNNFDDNAFNELIVQPIQKKFPHISLTKRAGTTLADIEKTVAAKDLPDIVFFGLYHAPTLLQVEALTDLTASVKESAHPLQSYDPVLIDTMKKYDPKNSLFALPYAVDIPAMFYNKDIFNTFGVSFPKDGMSWDEAIELGKRITRNEGGTQYVGFHPNNWSFLSSQLSLNYINPQTGKAAVQEAGFQQVFGTIKKAFDVQGIAFIQPAQTMDMFTKSFTLAMFPTWLTSMASKLVSIDKAGTPFNWDMVQQPTFKGTNNRAEPQMFGVSVTSKHNREAYQVISYLTSSKEVQTDLAKSGRVPALNDTAVRERFAETLTTFKGKNISFLSKNRFAPSYVPNRNDSAVTTAMNAAQTEMMKGQKDINTLLREAEETANKKIQELTR